MQRFVNSFRLQAVPSLIQRPVLHRYPAIGLLRFHMDLATSKQFSPSQTTLPLSVLIDKLIDIVACVGRIKISGT